MKSKKERVSSLAEELASLMATLRTLHGERHGLPSSFLFELTMAQFKTMMALISTGGVTSRGLAERLQISASAVTPLVDKLVELRFARREDDPSDRRISWIRPTTQAQTLYSELTNINQTLLAEIADNLTVDEISQVQRGFALFARAAKEKLAVHLTPPKESNNGEKLLKRSGFPPARE